MGESLDDSKRRLRSRLRQARRAVDRETARRLSAIACARVARIPAFAACRVVVGYVPIDGEIDPTPILTEIDADPDRRMFLPAIVDGGLEFRGAENGVRQGTHGTWEPVSSGRLRGATDGVAMIIPGVAFDGAGRRLGMGGGYYDRALSGMPRALRIGLGFEFQIVSEVPAATWDECVDFVVTETRIIAARRGAHKEMNG